MTTFPRHNPSLQSHSSRSLAGLLIATLLKTTCFLVLSFGATLPSAYGDPEEAHSKPQISFTKKEFTTAVSDKMEAVDEFAFIRERAKEMGIQVYLFGGTAAAYAHYVKWDLLREKGDPKYKDDRFDYSYSNIFRSTQDLDLVIDGTPEQASTLENLLSQKFNYVVGGKSAWEVRLLKEGMGLKASLLDNPEMLEQHSDSHSTGLIEVSESNDPPIRDLRAWDSLLPPFVTDVLNDEITFYFSETHHSTNMAARGDNPEIIAAVRLLTKAFQYELKITGNGLAQIQKIIDEFNPYSSLETPYARNRIETVGTNMIRHAVNMEYASQVITDMKLKEKLKDVGNVNSEGSMAWWVNRKPLPSFKIGGGSGRTAKALNLQLLAHETLNFEAFESITRAHTGEANVLESRRGVVGEGAAHGDGFYTKIGNYGAKNTGFTIRFHLHPDAKEGTDFEVSGDFVIILNKAAIEVIPESLSQLSLFSYFKLLSDGYSMVSSEKAQMEKFRRRFTGKEALTEDEIEPFVSYIEEALLKYSSFHEFDQRHENFEWVANEWVRFGLHLQLPKLTITILKALSKEQRMRMLAELKNYGAPREEESWRTDIALFRFLIQEAKRTPPSFIVKEMLPEKKWVRRKHNLEELFHTNIDNHNFTSAILTHVLTLPHWKKYGHLIDEAEKIFVDGADEASPLSSVVDALAAVLEAPHWSTREALLDKIIQLTISRKDEGLAKTLIHHVFNKDHWSHRLENLQEILETEDLGSSLVVSRALVDTISLEDNSESNEALLIHALKSMNTFGQDTDFWNTELLQMQEALLRKVFASPNWDLPPHLFVDLPLREHFDEYTFALSQSKYIAANPKVKEGIHLQIKTYLNNNPNKEMAWLKETIKNPILDKPTQELIIHLIRNEDALNNQTYNALFVARQISRWSPSPERDELLWQLVLLRNAKISEILIKGSLKAPTFSNRKLIIKYLLENSLDSPSILDPLVQLIFDEEALGRNPQPLLELLEVDSQKSSNNSLVNAQTLIILKAQTLSESQEQANNKIMEAIENRPWLKTIAKHSQINLDAIYENTPLSTEERVATAEQLKTYLLTMDDEDATKLIYQLAEFKQWRAHLPTILSLVVGRQNAYEKYIDEDLLRKLGSDITTYEDVNDALMALPALLWLTPWENINQILDVDANTMQNQRSYVSLETNMKFHNRTSIFQPSLLQLIYWGLQTNPQVTEALLRKSYIHTGLFFNVAAVSQWINFAVDPKLFGSEHLKGGSTVDAMKVYDKTPFQIQLDDSTKGPKRCLLEF